MTHSASLGRFSGELARSPDARILIGKQVHPSKWSIQQAHRHAMNLAVQSVRKPKSI